MTGSEHHGHRGETPAGEQEEFSESVGEMAKAEEHAKKILEKAEERRVEIISNARKKAAEIIDKAAEEAEQKRESIIESEKKKIDSENSEIASRAKASAGELKKKPFKQLAARLAQKILPG